MGGGVNFCTRRSSLNIAFATVKPSRRVSHGSSDSACVALVLISQDFNQTQTSRDNHTSQVQLITRRSDSGPFFKSMYMKVMDCDVQDLGLIKLK